MNYLNILFYNFIINTIDNYQNSYKYILFISIIIFSIYSNNIYANNTQVNNQRSDTTSLPVTILQKNNNQNTATNNSSTNLFNWHFSGSLENAILDLNQYIPHLKLKKTNLQYYQNIYFNIDNNNLTSTEAVALIEERIHDKATLVYNNTNKVITISYKAKNNNALVEAQKWRNGQQPEVVTADNGLLLYPFGAYQPIITCKVLEICDIQLDKSEKIINAVIGDSVRWITLPGMSGNGDNSYTHIFLKPTQAGLETNLIITTNMNRTYDIKLYSSNMKGLGRVGFYYPNDIIKQQNDEIETNENSITVSTDPIKMNFNYTIYGKDDISWKPIAVNDDGVKTYIHLTKQLQEVPIFFIIDDANKPQQVNYRILKNGMLFVVDLIFKHGQLIMGTKNDDDKQVIDIYNGNFLNIINSKPKSRFKHWFD